MLSGRMTGNSEVHLDEKRPTLTCDLRRVVRSQSAVCRLFAQVDFRREIRTIAFVDPGACTSTDLAELLQADFSPLSFGILCQQRCIYERDNVTNFDHESSAKYGNLRLALPVFCGGKGRS